LHLDHFQFTREELKQIAMSHQTWRNEIDVGGEVDIQVVRGKVSGWMHGVVTSVSADLLSIKFADSPPEYDKMIDRWSTRVAQAGMKTSEDYEWRR